MYSEAIDVFSLGIILFQMLFVTANVAIHNEISRARRVASTEQGEAPPHPLEILKVYPLFNLADVKDRETFFNKVRTVSEAESEDFLNKYIEDSKVRRSKAFIDIMR